MSRVKVKDREYLFLTAMISSREARMPNGEGLERLLAAESFDDCARQLTGCGYPDLSGLDAGGVNAALSELRAELLNELEGKIPERCIIEAFRLKYDCHNAKVLVKASAAGVDGEALLSRCGSVPPETIMNCFNDGDLSALPQGLAAAIENARSILARTNNPQLADLSIDRACFARLLELGEEESSGFLTGYIKTLIDSANLRAFVRIKRMGKDADFLKSALIEGGTVAAGTLAAAAETGEPTLSALFSGTVFASAAEAGERAEGGGRLTESERLCDNAVTAFLKRAKLISFGAPPVIAYIAAVDRELTNVRMILTGKLSGIDPGVIRERLRETYA